MALSTRRSTARPKRSAFATSGCLLPINILGHSHRFSEILGSLLDRTTSTSGSSRLASPRNAVRSVYEVWTTERWRRLRRMCINPGHGAELC